MEFERVLVIFSSLIVLSQSEEEFCASPEKPKKGPETVQSHLKTTIRSVWREELLPEQTSEVKALKERIQAIESKLNTRVIFSVHRIGESNNPPLDQIITYSKVIVNEGQGMDPDSGVFVVPVSGIYQFSFSALTGIENLSDDGYNHASVKVFKNDDRQFNILSNPDESAKNSKENLSFSWLMSLTKDDKIYLKMYENGNTLHVKDHYPVVFNGHLLMAQ